MMNLVMLFALVLIFGLTKASWLSRTTIKDSGYEGVVVGISPMLKENQAQDLINAIKKSITETSDTLFVATHQQLYYKDVRILIPKAWTNTSIDAPATTERFEESNFKVDLVNPVYGHQPYTVQPGGCGEPGRYIHVTPEYLMDDSWASWWGPRGKALTKQWAQHRWGVFDEIGYNNDPRFPLYYWDEVIVDGIVEKVLRPNTCSEKQPTGLWMDITSNRNCNFEGDLPNENCRFVPDIDQNITSSLMAYQYLNHVEEFCERDSVHEHNAFAPNRHNLLCQGKSVWDVMKKHPDFNISQELLPNVNATRTQFTVVREVEASFVMVLDYSGSMDVAERMIRLQKAAQRWILHEVAEGSAVGIVGFSATAFMMANLTQIKGDDSRHSLADAITNKTVGSTCIGCGLRMAVNILKETSNKVIILISDGAENQPPFIQDVMNEVVTSGARLVTIAFGTLADENMEKLAQNTGGKSYIVFDDDDGTMADDAFEGALTYQPGNSLTNTSIEIYEYVYSGSEMFGNGSFVVDATVGRNLKFRLSANSAVHIRNLPVIISPNGTVHDNVSVDTSVNLWTIAVDTAEPGVWSWEVELSGHIENNMRISVTAQAKDPESLPIYTESWMNVGSQNVNASQNLVIIYARVTQGDMPVVGAKVRAYVIRPDSTDAAVELDLFDNGQGADTQGGDGVYSRYFTLYSVSGRYAVKAQVWDEGSTYINNGFIASRRYQKMSVLPHRMLANMRPLALARMAPASPLDGPEPCCGSAVPFNPNTAIPTGQFTRTAVAGSFQVTSVPASGDYFAPSRVLDLEVSSENRIQLNLTWTATGDDLDTGIVSGYEIRMSPNRTNMLENTFDFAGNETILLDHLESGNMTNILLEAGETVSLSLNLQEELEIGRAYYFALRAVDDDGKKSDVSNQAMFFANMVPADTTEGLAGWAIALIVVGVIVGVLVIAGVTYLAKKRK